MEIDYGGRILADYEFIEWLKSSPDVKNKGRHLMLLMFIKQSSKYYLDENNIMLDFDIERVKQKFPKIYNDVTSAFKVESSEQVRNADNDIAKRVKFASNQLSRKPFKIIYIFTTKELATQYQNSGHIRKMESIQIKYGSDAINLIENWAGMWAGSIQD